MILQHEDKTRQVTKFAERTPSWVRDKKKSETMAYTK